ncbi:MAG: hypothetical protein CMM84_03840 [Rhodothermaceae bacterium]|nr:hypothetical protein [Rhodothermaceae bacterium]MBC15349.1 hypothetical protein [Rhodothermaceae bacterium]
MTLYQIDDELLTLIQSIQDAGGEVTDEQNARLDALLDAREDKADGYIAIIRQMQAEADAYKAEADRLDGLRRAATNKADRLKSRLLDSMQRKGEDVLTGRLGKVRVQHSGSASVVLLADPEDLPARFQRVTVAADKTALKAALAEQDPEAVRVAEISESRTPYLRIY